MNTAPDSVDQNGLTDAVGAFFTFGPGGTMGIYVLTVLGILLLAGALVAWVHTENRRLLEFASQHPQSSGGTMTSQHPQSSGGTMTGSEV